MSDRKRKMPVYVDIALAVAFVAVMALALVQEAPHEYVGIAVFVLVAVHVAMHRNWLSSLAKGRYNVVRVLQMASIVALTLCLVGMIASSLVLSKHAFWFLPALPGASWARRMHMLCSYWSFVLAFAHAGLQLKNALARIGVRLRGSKALGSGAIWCMRGVWFVVAAFGAYSFAQLGLPAYLLGQVAFAFADPTVPLAYTALQYASVAVLITGLFHYLRVLLERAQHTR